MKCVYVRTDLYMNYTLSWAAYGVINVTFSS